MNGHNRVYKGKKWGDLCEVCYDEPDGNREELSPELSQKLRNRSPDGFNWGYVGSGPAQLALALLMEEIPVRDALALYGQFNFRVVAEFGKEWQITSNEILQHVLVLETQPPFQPPF